MELGQARSAVVELLALVMELEPTRITDDALLEADLGADSLAVVEVVFGIEERHGIRLADDVVRGVRTVSDLVTAVAD
ncbi:acyl carrier protein [Nocardioides baekrokdamisoli]|uniref:Acyl carrier protein n=1 Tax=Nocardioides baekrokdamisoli TaxID=1804624 RepID=A0A3G9IH76_9ACTN|nr:acyl carrier protein [Nocardioides baekrokdamisoli]BBH18377.1 acyl carrier protein [Nocardioides baekrokdamisoli]